MLALLAAVAFVSVIFMRETSKTSLYDHAHDHEVEKAPGVVPNLRA